MIDRKTRDQMVKALRAYMSEEITAFQFDKVLEDAKCKTDDETAWDIADALWFHYDDLKDHKIVASKEQWDYFNRLLLLLESDGELEEIKSGYKWHPCQAIAAVLLLSFMVISIYDGFSEHLFVYALPFGPLSMFIAWRNLRLEKKKVTPREIALMPFPSITSLLAVRRSVSEFARRRYPKAIAERRVRDPIGNSFMWVSWLIVWCMLSPVALFFQMLPEAKYYVQIRMSEPQPQLESREQLRR